MQHNLNPLKSMKDERRLYNLLPVEDDGMEDLEVKVEVETAESVRGSYYLASVDINRYNPLQITS